MLHAQYNIRLVPHEAYAFDRGCCKSMLKHRQLALNTSTASRPGLRTIHMVNGSTAPQTRTPWFGYMLFQAAVSPKTAAAAKLGSTAASSSSKPGRLARITSAAATPGCGRGQIKIWPVVHRGEFAGSTELRVVLLNKSDREDCRVALDVKGNFGDGSLMWMMPDEKSGPERMAAKVRGVTVITAG